MTTKKTAKETAETLKAANAALEASAEGIAKVQAKVTPDPHGDIDQRMAALLQDHQRMGARPKE